MTTYFVRADDAALEIGTHVASAHAGVLRLSALEVPASRSALSLAGRRSYTGQPIVEIHAPGSPPLLEADPGRSFRSGACGRRSRASSRCGPFFPGRIDLVQAEAVLGVIDAADAGHLTAALRQLAGGVSGRIVRLRDGLLDLLADLEAGLDFVDEDIQFVSSDEVVRPNRAGRAGSGRAAGPCANRGCSRPVGRESSWPGFPTRERARCLMPSSGATRPSFPAQPARPATISARVVRLARSGGRVDRHGRMGRWATSDQTDVARRLRSALRARAVGAGGSDRLVFGMRSGSRPSRSSRATFWNPLRRQERPHLVVRTKADLARPARSAILSP